MAFLCALAPLPALAQLPAPAAPAGGSSQSIDDIRKTYPIHAGPLYVRPAVQLKELGVDTNVFNEASEPKSDFTFTVTPRADLAVPLARRALVTALLGSDLVYYATYDTERSIDPAAAVRANVYAGRVTLFGEGSYLNSHQRANYEIDVRARQLQNDVAGGLSVRLTPKLSAEVAARRAETRFASDAFYEGQRLQDTLNRDTRTFTGTMRHKLSPLTTIGVRYDRQEDRFPISPVRNTDSFRVMPGVEFKPRALINGSAWVGYRSFTPKDPIVPAQTGLVSQLGLSYTLLGATTFGVTYDRDYQFSYQVATPYFVDNSVGVFIRRAVGGRFDVIANAARHRYTYQAMAIQPAQLVAIPDRVDTTDNYGVNLGYRLKRQTRWASACPTGRATLRRTRPAATTVFASAPR